MKQRLGKSGLFCLYSICLLYAIAVFADFLAPLPSTDPNVIDRIAYAPPMKIEFSREYGFHFNPVIAVNDPVTLSRSFKPNKDKLCKLSWLVQGYDYKLLGFIKTNLHLLGSPDCPTEMHLLGTDKLGDDYLSRLLIGLRPSLFTGLLGILIVFPIGILYGLVAGYRGGALDEVMMRIVEIILSLPTFYVLIILAALIPEQVSNLQRLFLTIAIVSLIGWAGLARVVRGQVKSLVNRPFVQASRLIGVGWWRIMLAEILPQLSSYLIIAITLSFPSFVLAETTLSFLGLGVNRPDPSLGNLLTEAQTLPNIMLRPWFAICPSLVLVMITWCSTTLGDGLRDLYDPKSLTRS